MEACSLVAGDRATLEEELAKAKAGWATEASRLRSTSERLKRVADEKQAAEAEVAKLKSAILSLEADMKAQEVGVNEYVDVSRKFKNDVLKELRTVRSDAVKDFLASDACKFLHESKYDEARVDGFEAAIGQCRLKGWIPDGCDVEAEGLSAFKNADGSDFAPDGVLDNNLFKSEFVEHVCEETEELKYNHGGPYLPSFVPGALMSSVFVPLEDHLEHNQEWLTLPGPVCGFDGDLNLMPLCPAFLKELKARKEQRRSGSGRDKGGPSRSQQSQAAPRRDKDGPSQSHPSSSEQRRR